MQVRFIVYLKQDLVRWRKDSTKSGELAKLV
jgi:hypothetical protein